MVACTGDREIGVVSGRVGMYVYEVDQELEGGESSSSARPEVGNRPPEKKKNGKSPEVCLEGEGMVPGRMEKPESRTGSRTGNGNGTGTRT